MVANDENASFSPDDGQTDTDVETSAEETGSGNTTDLMRLSDDVKQLQEIVAHQFPSSAKTVAGHFAYSYQDDP